MDQQKTGSTRALFAPLNEDAATWVAVVMLTGVMLVLWLA